VRALHSEGLSTTQIAQESGLTVRTVQQYLSDLGLVSHDRESVRERTDRAVSLYQAGVPEAEIAAQLGYYSAQEVRRALRRRGVA